MSSTFFIDHNTPPLEILNIISNLSSSVDWIKDSPHSYKFHYRGWANHDVEHFNNSQVLLTFCITPNSISVYWEQTNLYHFELPKHPTTDQITFQQNLQNLFTDIQNNYTPMKVWIYV